jgi:nicotinamidase-related amidase
LSAKLDLGLRDVFEICKGLDPNEECYSGFGTPKNPTQLLPLLRFHNIGEVVVVGLALDYCVGSTALDAVKAGLKVTIINEGTRSASEETKLKMV